MNERLLKVRNELKDRNPRFIRQDNPKRMKVNDKWRKPKGVHSKIRHAFKGRRKMPSPGYKSPAAVKGLHATGLKMVQVFSVEQISKLNKDKEGAVIGSAVGMKNRLVILKKAKEMNVQVLNLNLDATMKKIEDSLSARKNRKKHQEKREAKKEEKKEKKEEPKQETTHEHKDHVHAEHSHDDKKKEEKHEKDKILTRKS